MARYGEPTPEEAKRLEALRSRPGYKLEMKYRDLGGDPLWLEPANWPASWPCPTSSGFPTTGDPQYLWRSR